MSEKLRDGVHERAVNPEYTTLGRRTKVRFLGETGGKLEWRT